jgi:hypothetical protein
MLGPRSPALAGLAILALYLIVVSCEEPVSEPSRASPRINYALAGDTNPYIAEPEIFGDIYMNGVRTEDPGFYIELQPDDETEDRLPHYNAWMWADTAAGDQQHPKARMFGWFHPKAGGNCGGSIEDFPDTTNRLAEIHWPDPNTPPSGREKHCVLPGRYELTVWYGQTQLRKHLWIDYVPLVPAGTGDGLAKKIWNSTYGVYEAVEAVNYDDPANVWIDVVAQIDLTPGPFQDSSVLDAQNVGETDPSGGTFVDQSPLAGTDLDWFRFSVARSGSNWDRSHSELPEGVALSRVQWDRERNPSLMTGFYDALTRGRGPQAPNDGQYVLRLHRFHDHVLESRTVIVGLETMRPDEQPDSTAAGITATRPVTITRVVPPTPPTVTITGPSYISTPGNYTWTANVSGGTPPYTYQWYYKLLTGGTWQKLTGQTNPSYTRYVGYSQWAFRLRADVTDSLGLVGSGGIVVDVAWGARPITEPSGR